MRLDALAHLLGARLDGPPGSGALVVDDVVHDHRHVRAAGTGSRPLLATRRSFRMADRRESQVEIAGRARAGAEQGAVAILADHRPDGLDPSTPVIIVDTVLAALGPAASLVHSQPSTQLDVAAVTGTDGKTTTCYMLAAALGGSGRPVGLCGTVESVVGSVRTPSNLTTAEAPDIQRALRRMLDAGDRAAVLEASSTGLDQGRLRGTRVSAAGFTNLSHEHMDYHGDLAEYFRSKSTLFTPEYTNSAVINVDTPHGGLLLEHAIAHGLDVCTVSAHGEPAAVRQCSLLTDAWGHSDVIVDARGRKVELHVAMPGNHNVQNAMLALGLALTMGVDPAAAAAGIATIDRVPGRMEAVPNDCGIQAFVDYAHTPAGMRAVLTAARSLVGPGGRVIVVAGAGGKRDRTKRPLIGDAAQTFSDLFVVTSDNPRDEDPEAIIREILSGTGGPAKVVIEPDRRSAIALAAEMARPGDVLVVAGKGHETDQLVGDQALPFDDRQILGLQLTARAS